MRDLSRAKEIKNIYSVDNLYTKDEEPSEVTPVCDETPTFLRIYGFYLDLADLGGRLGCRYGADLADEEVDNFEDREKTSPEQKPEGATNVTKELQEGVTQLLLHLLVGHGGQVDLDVHQVFAPVADVATLEVGELLQKVIRERIGRRCHVVDGL